MRTITLNGKTTNALPANYNLFCGLSKNGVEIEELFTKPLEAARAYVAMCFGMTMEEAGNAIEEYIIADGNLTDILEILYNEVNDSAFFQKLLSKVQKETEETPATEKKAVAKKK